MTQAIVHRVSWSRQAGHQPTQLLSHEWLLTNGLGGYASGTVSGVCTRRYHGLLVAALPTPLGRMMMLNHMVEEFRLPNGGNVPLGGNGTSEGAAEQPATLASFTLSSGLPIWRYEVAGYVLEKRIVMPHRGNTVHLMYRVIEGDGSIRLRLRPGLHFRGHEGAATEERFDPYQVAVSGQQCEVVSGELPPLRMQLRDHPGALVLDGGKFYEVDYPRERERGYAYRDVLWSPGYFRADLMAGESVTLTVSTEPWDALTGVAPADALEAELDRRRRLLDQADPHAQHGMAAELVLAADQFVISPSARVVDEAMAHASGDEARSVIAGYHWFTDWGRDTMISLEGLTLTTGRHIEAGYILRTFGHYIRDGLIPNLFPEGKQAGLYHTADATLWYFHALDRYLAATGDRATLRLLLPKLREVVDHHVKGTRFGIGVDPADGLLRQGQDGYQLTWMDAKVGDWVVTPRRGKAVEINALWHNALRLLAGWLLEEGQQADSRLVSRHADKARRSFNERFWMPDRGWLYDVVDTEGPDDASLRPNQVLAISLPHAILEERHWEGVLNAVRERLVTPVGLRSLAPGEPNYKACYDGDLRSRDAAYHQGTVWAWLIGPFVDAWLKVHPGATSEARAFLRAFPAQLDQACIGSISEIYDAEPPYTPCGCIAQAWSVAEVLRAWVKTDAEDYGSLR
jgi:predicted glycogen debranching enzyme